MPDPTGTPAPSQASVAGKQDPSCEAPHLLVIYFFVFGQDLFLPAAILGTLAGLLYCWLTGPRSEVTFERRDC